jgi:hypothetical protein
MSMGVQCLTIQWQVSSWKSKNVQKDFTSHSDYTHSAKNSYSKSWYQAPLPELKALNNSEITMLK